MYTVVVADDEEEIRRSLIRKVDWAQIGFQVVGEAENGVEAMDLVEKLEPDLLLTDVRMPFISGIELARRVREIRPTVQIAFLSGFDDFSYAQQAIQYNIISYLLKPISSAELTKELYLIKEKIDQKFEKFASRDQMQQKMEKWEFLMPLMLDGFQRSGSEDAEKELIEEKMAQLGTDNLSAYLRKMAIDGLVVKLELPELREMISLLRYSSNNLNQLTRHAHETGRLYDTDLEDMRQSYERLWEAANQILTSLAAIK